jgi:large repetitive protein
MRLPLLVSLVTASVALAQQAPQTARVEGTVRDINGGSVVGANVVLVLQKASGATRQPTSLNRKTDANGGFVFEAVLPGRYGPLVNAPGYVNVTASAAKPIELAAGDTRKSLDFNLTPCGSISGRVTDRDSKPLERADVLLLRSTYAQGRRQLVAYGISASTDSHGNYLLKNIPPGRYYVSVEDRSWASAKAEEKSDTAQREAFVATLFPSGLDSGTASPIYVGPGTESSGVDVRMRQERVFSIQGKALDADGKPVPSLSLILSVDRERVPSATRITSMTRPDGSFVFERLLPGDYVLNGQKATAGEVTAAGRVAVAISKTDVEDEVLRLGPPPLLTGQITVEGGDAQARPVYPDVALVPADFFAGMNAEIDRDGKLTLAGFAPAKYSMRVYNLPAGMYLKSIRLDGRDVTYETLDLTSGAAGRLEVVISAQAPDVSGTVRNKDGQPVPDALVTLRMKNSSAGFSRSVTADESGAFRMAGLAPGEYSVIGWEQIPPDGIVQAPEFVARFSGDAAAVKLEEGSHASVDVTVVPSDKIAYEAANVP